MRTSSLVVLVFAIIVLVSLLVIWFFPSIQDFMASNSLWNGLRSFAREKDLQELNNLDLLPEYSGGSVLISIPYQEYQPEDLERIHQFVTAGNLLVILDDFGYGNQMLARLGSGVRFNGGELLDPLFCYKNGNFPRVVEFSPEVSAAGIRAVVLNHGTCLENVEGIKVLAWSSSSSFLDVNRNGVQDKSEISGPFPLAAEYQVGRGTVRLFSDPSLIINTMRGQNDNRLFSDYLLSGPAQTGITLLDFTHLNKSPLDDSKQKLKEFRGFLAIPYVTIGLIVVIFALAIVYTLRKGGIFG